MDIINTYVNTMNLIKFAIADADLDGKGTEWRSLAKKAWAMAENYDEFSTVADILWSVVKLHGNGNALRLNAVMLLRVAKRALQ